MFPNVFQKRSGTIQKSAQEHCSGTLRRFSKSPWEYFQKCSETIQKVPKHFYSVPEHF